MSDVTRLRMPSGEAAFFAEVRQAIKEGWLKDDPNSPTFHRVAVVGNQRSDRVDDVHQFVIDLGRKYPHAELVVGDTSQLEKQAATSAQDMELPATVIEKASTGEWDGGATIRDERVVAKATQVVAFDDSARSKAYQQLCKRMGKPFHRI